MFQFLFWFINNTLNTVTLMPEDVAGMTQVFLLVTDAFGSQSVDMFMLTLNPNPDILAPADYETTESKITPELTFNIVDGTAPLFVNASSNDTSILYPIQAS